MVDNRKIVHSAKWSSITELLSKIIIPFVNIILARILAPEVFGVVATFTLIITFAEVFTDAGFQKYLIQHEFESEEDREQSTDVAFWTNFCFSCLIWLLIFAFRDKLATMVGSPGYGREIAVMSLTIPMVALSSIQAALYKRDFKFKLLFPIRIATCAVPLFVTLPLALVFRNCWANIIGALAKEIVLMTALTIRSTWKPKLYYSFKKLKEMLSFSMIMMVDRLMIWFTSYAGTFIVSQYLTSYYIGIYKTGITTISSYIELIYVIMAPVFFAALSRYQNNQKECHRLYYSFQKYCSLFVIPLGVGVFVYRDLVTSILLGPQWSDAALILGGVALTMPISILTAQFNSDYFRSQGKPQISLYVQSSYVVVMIAVLLWAVKHTFKVLCIARICLPLAYVIVSTATICIIFKISLLKIINNIAIPLFASLIMAIVSLLLQRGAQSFIGIIISLLISCVIYVGVILLVPQTRSMVFTIINKLRENSYEH